MEVREFFETFFRVGPISMILEVISGDLQDLSRMRGHPDKLNKTVDNEANKGQIIDGFLLGHVVV